MAPSPMVTPGRMVALAPIEASLLTRVGNCSQSSADPSSLSLDAFHRLVDDLLGVLELAPLLIPVRT
jgi:hypothetical protein